MKFLSGPISDRLRKMFAADAKEWTPQRGSEKQQPLPKGVQGQSMTGRKKKK